MKSLLLTLAIFAVAQAAYMEPRWRPRPVSMNWIPVEVEDKIVGGDPAGSGNYEYQISLQRKSGSTWYHSCGGSVISDEWVITAAHCVDSAKNLKSVRVVAGIYRLSDTTSKGEIVGVSSIIVHESYNTRTLANDIALMRLKTRINSVTPIKISKDDVRMGDSYQVTGWGALSEGGSSPNELHVVTLPFMSNTECQSYLQPNDLHEAEMFCAGLVSGGKDSCQGDSGGPVARNSELVGLVSWGYGCARPSSPGVYTRVFNYKDWIRTNSGIDADLA